MKRFLDKKSDNKEKKTSQPCMEDIAKKKIREKILESGLEFGIFLNLREEEDKKPEKPPETPDEATFRWVFGEEGFKPTQYPNAIRAGDSLIIP